MAKIENKAKTRGNPNWKKGGVSPNPGGRPKSARYADAARKWLNEHADELIEKHGAAALGKKPDLAAARMIVEYAEGKARQDVDVNFDSGREMLERAVEVLMETHSISREEAIQTMLSVLPKEAAEWVN